jgi:hypothetical protein
MRRQRFVDRPLRQQLNLAAAAALVGAQPGKETHPGAALDPVQVGHTALAAGKNRHLLIPAY